MISLRIPKIHAVVLAATILAPAVSKAATGIEFENGFETDVAGWTVFGGGFTPARVSSGTNGVTSANGSFHAESGVTFSGPNPAQAPDTGSGSASDWGGFNFGAGAVPTVFREYWTSVAVYLDVDAGWANDTRFDFTSAINKSSDGTHLADFAFIGGFYNDAVAPGAGNRFVFSVSPSTGRNNAYPKNPDRDPIAISTTGWYTFEHHFYDNAGNLAVDLSIYDSGGGLVHTFSPTTPLTTPAIATVGGNRYGWFSNNEFSTLAFDDSKLTKVVFPEIAVYDGAVITDPELTDGQPTVVDFGTTTQGGGIARDFTIENTGDGPLTVASINAPAGFTVTNAPASVLAGGTATFTVTLSGANTGTFSGSVVINSDDEDEPTFDFPVTGTVNPQVVVAGTVLNVELGSLTGFTLTVRTPTSTTYTLQRVGGGAWIGADVPGVVTGFGSTFLTVQKAGVTAVNITDSNGTNNVTFLGRAASTDGTLNYDDDFTVTLDGEVAGGALFSGNNEFVGAASLTVAARGVGVGNVVNAQNYILQSVDGNITLSGNFFTADPPSGGGTIYGITQQGTIKTTGQGNIELNGRGGSGFNGSSIGININGGKVISEGTGTIMITGIGGPGSGLSSQANCKGIRIVNGEVSSASGAITLTGTSDALAGTGHSGITLQDTIIQGTNPLAPVTISLNGTGANAGDDVNGARSLHGVELRNASRISTAKGSISITGVAGTLPALSAGDVNYGVLIQDSSEVSSSGDATITIDGTGTIGGDDAMHGVLLTGTALGAKVSVADGDLSITGTSGGSDDAGSINHNAVVIGNADVVIESTGTGNIEITGKRAPGTANALAIGFQTQGSAAGSLQALGTGNITVNADSMRLLGSNVITTSSGNVTLRPFTAGFAVDVGLASTADSAIALGLADAELDQVSPAGLLIIGGSNTGVITQSGAISRATTTNLVFSSGSSSLPAIDLSSGLLFSSGGDVTLIGDSVDIGGGSIDAGAGTVTVQPQTASTLLDIGAADAVGTLGLTDVELDQINAGSLALGSASSDDITMSGSLTRTDPTNISLISAGAITVSELIDSNGGNVNLAPGTNVSPAGTGVDISMAATGFLAFPSGTDLAISIEGTTANDELTGHRQLSVVGGVDLTGVDLVLSGAYVPGDLETYVIVDNDGIDPVVGTFNGLPELTVFTFNGEIMWITYVGGDGNDVVLRTPGPPTVVTLPASQITGYTATLNSTVAANALSTTAWFEYSTDPLLVSGVIETPHQNIGSGVSSISFPHALAALAADSDYHFRIVATNSRGTSEGDILSFHTDYPVVSDQYFDATQGLAGGGEIYRPIPGVVDAAGRISFKAFGAVGTGGITSASDTLLMTDVSGSMRVVGREGDAALTGTLKGLFDDVVLTAGGQTIVRDRDDGAPSTSDYGYLVSPDGVSLEVLSWEGDAVPGGGTFKLHTGKPAVDESDRVYFSGDALGLTTKTDSGVWFENGGTLTKVVQEGDDATGVTGDPAWYGALSAMVAAGNDGVAFISSLQNNPLDLSQKTDRDKNKGVFAGEPGSVGLVLREGDAVPGPGGTTWSNFTGVGRSSTGDHAVLGLMKREGGVTSGDDQVLVAVIGGTPHLVAREGVTDVDGGAVPGRFGSYHVTAAGEVVFEVWVEGAGVGSANDMAICRWSVGGGLTVLAREGDAVAGSTYAILNSLSVSAAGKVAVVAKLADGTSRLMRDVDGAGLVEVVGTGDMVTVGGGPRTIYALDIYDNSTGTGGGGGGMGAGINDAGEVFTVLSLGSQDYVARVYE